MIRFYWQSKTDRGDINLNGLNLELKDYSHLTIEFLTLEEAQKLLLDIPRETCYTFVNGWKETRAVEVFGVKEDGTKQGIIIQPYTFEREGKPLIESLPSDYKKRWKYLVILTKCHWDKNIQEEDDITITVIVLRRL